MKKKLSKLISKAQKPEDYLSEGEVGNILKDSKLQSNVRIMPYRPNRILNSIRTKTFIIMLTILSLCAVFTLSVLTNSPDNFKNKPVLPNDQPIIKMEGSNKDTVERQSLLVRESMPQKLKTLPASDIEGRQTLKILSSNNNPKESMVLGGDSTTIGQVIDQDLLGIKKIRLDSLALNRLGIKKNFGGYNISYIDSYGYLSSINLFTTEEFPIALTRQHHGNITDEKIGSWGFSPLKLMGITTASRIKPKKVSYAGFYGAWLDPNLIERLLNACVPISIELTYSVPDEVPITTEAILWIVPNEEFFACMPDSIGKEMEMEFKTNVEPWIEGHEVLVDSVKLAHPIRKPKKDIIKNEPIPCNYFPDLCQGLPGLDNLNIYPNPTDGILNIDLIISRPKNITFRVFDISGRLLLNDLSQHYSSSGQYRETVDLQQLSPGFYILMLSDGEGANMTKRVIKK